MRLQILHLPAPPDEYPFAVVLDQCEDFEGIELAGAGEKLGARGVLVFAGEVEIV